MKLQKLAVPALVAALAVPFAASAKEVTLRGASCFPIGAPPGQPFEAVAKEINERGKGVVQVNMLGGAPAIGSPFTMTQRMAKGAYDIIGCTEAYFGNVLPEAPVLRLQEKTFAELRENGAIAYMQELFNAKGIHYVGRHHDFGRFHLYLSKPIAGPDLTGLHLRVAPVYTAFFTELGATVQRAAMPQIYTLMENGTVQGYGWPLRGYPPPWHKVTKYRVEPGFYNSSLHTLVNLRKWESLGQEARDIVTAVVLEAEGRAEGTSENAKALDAKQRAWHAEGGMETITFSDADTRKWSDTAREVAWEEVDERSPEHGPKLRELFAGMN